MKAALAGFWICLNCPDGGETTATESGADVKHKDATGHATISATHPGVLQRVRERVTT